MEEREIMKRKIISVLLTACLSISLLAGCGGNASKTDDSQVKEESSDTATQTTDTAQNEDPEVTITVLTRYAGSDVQAQWLQTMMEKFSELHPNVTFQDDSVADEAAYNNKLKTAIATGNLPNMWMQYGAASLVEYAKTAWQWIYLLYWKIRNLLPDWQIQHYPLMTCQVMELMEFTHCHLLCSRK